MKVKKFSVLAGLMALVLALTACGKEPASTDQEVSQEDGDKLMVYASTEPIYDFAKAIGGDQVEVKYLLGESRSPHHWEPSPDLLQDLSKSDLLLINGAGLENWLDDSIEELFTGDREIVDTSAHVDLLTAEESKDQVYADLNADMDHEGHDDHDHEEEGHHHHHGAYDPHYWLSPVQAEHQAQAIYEAFQKKDPDHKEDYQANFEALQKKFKDLEDLYGEDLNLDKEGSLIIPHQAFSYLNRDVLHCKMIALSGLMGAEEVDANRLSQLVDKAGDLEVKGVLYDAYEDPKQAKVLADEMGVEAIPFYTLETVSKEDRQAGEDYFSLMEKNLKTIKEIFNK